METATDIRCRILLSLLAVTLMGTANQTRADTAEIALYTAFGTADGYSLEGRVIEQRGHAATTASDSWFANLWRSMRRIVSDEFENFRVELSIAEYHWFVSTDAEGYFRVDVGPEKSLASGWHTVHATSADHSVTTAGSLLIVDNANPLGIISDMDDTLLVSDVNHKAQLLANTFLKNAQQRIAVAGAADALRRLLASNPAPTSAAIVYLTASPKQLYANIEEFLDVQSFPRGVLIAKRVTDDKTTEPLFDQYAYKTAKIEDIFRRIPQTKFILLGDDGEKDPETYRDIAAKFPARVAVVYIRKVNPDTTRPKYPDQHDMAELLR